MRLPVRKQPRATVKHHELTIPCLKNKVTLQIGAQLLVELQEENRRSPDIERLKAAFPEKGAAKKAEQSHQRLFHHKLAKSSCPQSNKKLLR